MTPNYLKKEKVLTHYKEGETPEEFVSKIEERYHHFFTTQLIWF